MRILIPGAALLALVLWFVVGQEHEQPTTTQATGSSAPKDGARTTKDSRFVGKAEAVPDSEMNAGQPSAANSDSSLDSSASPSEGDSNRNSTMESGPSWKSMPPLGPASGPARSANYAASFEIISDSCGNMPSSHETGFETGLVEGALVIQFENASWACELTGDGSFECPTLEEAKTESEDRIPHVERSARGVWRVDGSIEIQVLTRTWCEGTACDAEPCQWSFEAIATMTR